MCICCFPFPWESSASTLWKCHWSPCLFRCVSLCDVCMRVLVYVDSLCRSSPKCCVCVWCVNVTDHPISSTWLPMLASTCLCAQIFSVGNCILRPEEKTGALWVGGHLTPQKLYDSAVSACGCHAVSLYWNHKKGQITGCYDPRMVYLALEEIQICLIKFTSSSFPERWTQ